MISVSLLDFLGLGAGISSALVLMIWAYVTYIIYS
jgi:hypothetical protein